MSDRAPELIRLMKEEWLKGRRRNAQFSLRAFSRRLGIPASAVSELFNGKRDMTPKMAARVLQGMSLEPALRDAVLKSIKPPERKRKTRLGRRKFVELESDQFHVISEWFYYAVLSLAETEGFKPKAAWIARRLGISPVQAKLALERLTRLGLLKKSHPKSKPLHSGTQVTTTTDIPSSWLRQSHFENLKLAERALTEDPVEERDFSSMTLVSNPDTITEAKRRLREFRRELTELLESDGAKTEVYQLNMQYFRLTGRNEKKS